MRSRAAAAVLGLVAICCGPIASTPFQPLPSASSAATRCVDAVTLMPSPAPPVGRRDLAAPGRALFADDLGQLLILDGGTMRDVLSPYPVIRGNARLTEHGTVVAIVGSPQGAEAYLWTEKMPGRSETLVPIPGAFSQSASFVWSPSAQRLLYSPSFGASEIYVLGGASGVYRASLGPDLTHVGIWRTDDEVTLLTARPQTRFPLADATLWSWRPPADPVRLAGPLTLNARPQWSPDGQTLATIEEASTGGVVHLRGTVDRTIVRESELRIAAMGCGEGGQVQIVGLSWSPDGRTLALLGRSARYLVAFSDLSNHMSVFAAPGARDCYIPAIAWSHGEAVVPLFGTDCGYGGGDLSNALGLVDPSTARTPVLTPITRKGFLTNAGRWVAMASANGTTFFSLDEPTVRLTVPFTRLVDYCCAP